MLSDKDYKAIEAYLGNSMSPDEVSKFEQRLVVDQILKNEVQLFKSINEHLITTVSEAEIPNNQYSNLLESYLESEEAEKLKHKIKSLFIENKKRKQYKFYWAAAILLIFVSIGSGYLWNLKSSNPKNIFNHYYDINDIHINIKRGGEESLNTTISNAFKEKKYKESLFLFNEYSKKEINIDTSLFLIKGASHLALKETDSAIASFQILAKSNLLDKSKGEWFLALTYVKNNKLKEAESVLNKIKNDSNHYKKHEAIAILKKIK